MAANPAPLVFVTSQTVDCLERLRADAKSMPVAVLIAVPAPMAPPVSGPSLDLLRAVSAEIQGPGYPHHVMSFALLGDSTEPHDKPPSDATLRSSCLDAGALGVLRSPLGRENCDQLLSRIKEVIRPPAHLIGASMTQFLVDSIQCTSVPENVAHRPDLTLPLERRDAVEEAVAQWHFPALDLNMDELTYGALYMLERTLSSPDLEPYRISRTRLMGFLLATRRQYKHEQEVYYHNWRHAVDVTQSIYCFLLDARLSPVAASDHRPIKDLNPMERLLTPLDGLLLLTSAIGHDVGHPGVNNAFLTMCNHPIAQMYNDKSVLESYHCAAYSQMLRLHWPSLNSVPGFRSSMIANILATDMQRHFEYMTNLGDMKHRIASSGKDTLDWPDAQRAHARELMMALLMKAADISNIARPFDVSSRWAKILMCEFARQGELEEELGIPTCLYGGPPNKEDLLAAAQSQKAFMGLFGVPLFTGMAEIMPSVYCAVQELQTNQVVWDEKIDHEKQRQKLDDERLPLTFSAVTKAEVEEAKVRHHKSEPSAVPAEAFQPPSTPVKRHPVVDSETVSLVYPAGRQKKHVVGGGVGSDDKRWSAPFLPPGSPLSINGSGSSRRSSKDVALGQLHLPGTFAHQSLSPGSRRGSADVGWHFQQSCPGSRRGSKDESLTTILVTSTGQGSPTQRGSPVPASSDDAVPSGSMSKQNSRRTSLKQQPATVRTSIPSARSHTTSSTATATPQHSPSTQPSSLAIADDPFTMSSIWSNDLDGARSTSSRQQTDPVNPSLVADHLSKEYPAPAIPRSAREDSDDTMGVTRKAERSLRESRSRSRLRGLKFWKKKRDASGIDDHESGSP